MKTFEAKNVINFSYHRKTLCTNVVEHNNLHESLGVHPSQCVYLVLKVDSRSVMLFYSKAIHT